MGCEFRKYEAHFLNGINVRYLPENFLKNPNQHFPLGYNLSKHTKLAPLFQDVQQRHNFHMLTGKYYEPDHLGLNPYNKIVIPIGI